MPPREVTYERPVAAKLYVHLDNGDQFEAGPADIEKFGYTDPSAAYRRLGTWITAALERNGVDKAHDIRETGLCPIHYAVECALFYDDMPDDQYGDQIAHLARVNLDESGAANA